MKSNPAIVWLRQDFRILRNEALSFATNNHANVSVIYIFKKKKFDNKREAQKWWIYESLKNFKSDLEKYNVNLEIASLDTYQDFFEKYSKKNLSFYWNKIYEPDYINFDRKISKFLKNKNVSYKIFKGNILNEYQEVTKKDNTPFKVFTHFWNTAEPIYIKKEFRKKISLKKSLKKIKILETSNKLETILPKKKWFKKFHNYWTPSEKKGLEILNNFVENQIMNYGENRDIPGVFGTSRISPYLANGQINVETAWDVCENIKSKSRGYRKYINELGWREFSHSLINYFPSMLKGNLRKEFDNFPWVKNNQHLVAWKKGFTGYPIVDAGMRELNETGWMHNRVRMITGSFLVKHLRIHWMEGEKYFRNCLLDFNEANNVSGWQWVAGCGADAAPYFRIFNPVLQGEKFDKDGEYVKKWVPELKNAPVKFIHKPWEMTKEIQESYKILIGIDYPKPIVNHANARQEALKAFSKIKK